MKNFSASSGVHGTFQIGAYGDSPSSKSGFGELTFFTDDVSFRSAAKKAVTMAFDPAGTDRRSRYVVKAPDGKVALDFEVTSFGNEMLLSAARDLLKNHKAAFRSIWATDNYTRYADHVLYGDTQAISNALGEVIAPGAYKIDQNSTVLLAAIHNLLPIASPSESIAKTPMTDADRQGSVKKAEAFRAASRVEGLPEDEIKRLCALDEVECLKLLDDPVKTLRWAVETLASELPADAKSNSVLFAIRTAFRAQSQCD